ncbi:MAG: dihydrolipoyllysine-residue acetyltransferase [Rhodocyclaceae bacterium]
MSETIEVRVPDIGDFKDVPVIEVMVKPGDAVRPEDPLVTLESDKATLDVPSPAEGTVRELKLKAGDKVSEGSLILLLEARAVPPGPTPQPVVAGAPEAPPVEAGAPIELRVPDIGDFKDVPVIDVAVAPGARIRAEDTLVTLESDKATMDVPAALGGLIKSVRVKPGDRVSEGSVILTLIPDVQAGEASPASVAAAAIPQAQANAPEPAAAPGAATAQSDIPAAGAGDMVLQPSLARMPSPAERAAEASGGHGAHASPSVRRFARELGVEVAQLSGSGPKGRILREDVQNFVKQQLAAPRAALPAAGGLDLLPWPQVDFAKFGPVETKPLSRIQKISGANLARNWVRIPHVTQFDEADITELEAFRVQVNKEQEKAGVKLTLLAFLIKACVAALRQYPQFNASLDGESLVLKGYFHIGFAADTPNGLVVPVLRDADRKGVLEIARETSALAATAREGRLAPGDMQGGCFSISSLGGIGGTAFTPIINAPEVAILGVSKTATKPVWDGKQFVPRLMLPLSLSYDHRVIDGAAAARFTAFLARSLADMRRVLL